ncbi:Uncharacterized protein dnl_62960 [Desulfonema limicola]|uniref:Transcriptional regulator n=1 Tax=Desulfonema limicola TaxID=45656 RepID=A0A975BEW6_9BACT|nr:helix-turn-helix transcriptional regulator [Desulfonema limicola]QTA83874.1 Uncharacterized protein dnl_62960 [Desulfonema limicola]
MNTLTNYQIINNKAGKPLFVVIPYDEFQLIQKQFSYEPVLPNEVVGLHIMEDKSLLCAWREYKNILPETMAESMGITIAEYTALEKANILASHMLTKAANVLGIDAELLTE